MERELPKEALLNTLKLLLNRNLPPTDNVEPHLTKLRVDMELPTLK
jgi:hypothetical protein